jgi:hypothetical protein
MVLVLLDGRTYSAILHPIRWLGTGLNSAVQQAGWSGTSQIQPHSNLNAETTIQTMAPTAQPQFKQWRHNINCSPLCMYNRSFTTHPFHTIEQYST